MMEEDEAAAVAADPFIPSVAAIIGRVRGPLHWMAPSEGRRFCCCSDAAAPLPPLSV